LICSHLSILGKSAYILQCVPFRDLFKNLSGYLMPNLQIGPPGAGSTMSKWEEIAKLTVPSISILFWTSQIQRTLNSYGLGVSPRDPSFGRTTLCEIGCLSKTNSVKIWSLFMQRNIQFWTLTCQLKFNFAHSAHFNS
jgi:hypothetical protein